MMLGASRAVLSRRRPPLDGVPNVVAGFSYRRLLSRATGALVRARRSGDSAEADFAATPGPVVNWNAVSSFADGGGGGNPFKAKWYDQTGLGHDILQATASAQPQLGLLSNGKIGATFNGIAHVMMTAAFTLAQPWWFVLAYRRKTTVQVNFENMIDGLTADSGTLFHNITGTGAPTDNSMFAGDFGPQSDNGISMATGVRGAVGGLFNGAGSFLIVNATTVPAAFTGNPLTGTPGGLTIGCRADSNAGRFTNMEVQEFYAGTGAISQGVLAALVGESRRFWR